MSAAHLLTRTAQADYQEAIRAASDVVGAHLATSGPRSPRTVEELTEIVQSSDLNTPLGSLEEALNEVSAMYVDHAVWYHDPGYLAHLNCPVTLPALAAEVMVSAINTSMDTWDQSTAGTLMERRLIAWTADRLGFADDPSPSGIFTSGGTQSNLHALLLAREHARARGADLGPMRVLTSENSHFSVSTACSLLGLSHAPIAIPTDARGRLRVDWARAQIDALTAEGAHIMAIIATAGTTDLGAIDPLPEVGQLCREHDIWMHVDAAYGGGLMMSERNRHRLDGIALANSVTVDFHKTAFQPVSSSALIVADRSHLLLATHHADYLNPRHSTLPNQVDISLQTTRRFDALKLWMTLRTIGPEVIGEQLDEVMERARQVADYLEREPEFELAARPGLSTVLFRWAPPQATSEQVDQLVAAIRTRAFDRGELIIASTTLDGRPWLKFTLLNPETSLDQIISALTRIRQLGMEVFGELERQTYSVGAGTR